MQEDDLASKYFSDVSIDVDSKEYRYYSSIITRFPDEAIYIYSFKEKRMLYAIGWEDLLGYPDDSFTLKMFVEATAPEYAAFTKELNEKALKFIWIKGDDLESFAFTFELKKLHKNGTAVPVIARLAAHKCVHGMMEEVIMRVQYAPNLKFGKVIKFTFHGKGKEEFETILHKELKSHSTISEKEKEALSLAAKGYSFKEIADLLGVSHSAIEKRIIPMYKRFGVKSLSHLISFAYEHEILP